MILYDTHIPVGLQPFGIQIPIQDNRATKTFEVLCGDPDLGPIEKWHHDRITERLSQADLLRAHAPEYVQRLYSDQLADEIIATYELVNPVGQYHRYAPDQAIRQLGDLFQRILIKAAGTVQAARIALQHGFCFSFSGGMHHAHYNYGSGFCLINDIVIAGRKLQFEQKVRNLWVIDVDAHKGDGTAALTKDDPTIHTLSIHMADGWPLNGLQQLADGSPNPAFTPSDIDIPVESGQEAFYNDRLRQGLSELRQRGKADLALVVCGADPYSEDALPSTAKLKLSLDQMLERDQLIYRFLEKQDVPAAFLTAGGYGDQVWKVYAQFLVWVLRAR